MRDLAETLGVSMGMAFQALAIIREEGLVSPRPAVGSVVCAKDHPLWKGQVLVVVPPGIGNYRENTVHAVLRDTLTAAGYMPLAATVPYAASGLFEDFALLETMLRQQVDLTVCLHDSPAVTSWLGKRGVKFALFGRLASEAPSCVGFVDNRDDLALDDFVARCRATGVSSVLQLTAIENGPDAIPALRAAGLRAADWRIPPPDGGRDATGLVQRAADEFAARLAKGRRWQSGETQVLSFNVPVPSEPCSIGLWMPDAAPSLSNDSRYALRCANAVAFKDGVNILLAAASVGYPCYLCHPCETIAPEAGVVALCLCASALNRA